MKIVNTLFYSFFTILMSGYLVVASAEDATLKNLRSMRMKQEQQEIVVREQKFVRVENETHCTPVQQTRQRLKDIGNGERPASVTNLSIHAGHEEMNIDNNQGTINSDVNVQVIKEGDHKECL
jgi:predicted membrane protein